MSTRQQRRLLPPSTIQKRTQVASSYQYPAARVPSNSCTIGQGSSPGRAKGSGARTNRKRYSIRYDIIRIHTRYVQKIMFDKREDVLARSFSSCRTQYRKYEPRIRAGFFISSSALFEDVFNAPCLSLSVASFTQNPEVGRETQEMCVELIFKLLASTICFLVFSPTNFEHKSECM